MARAKAEPTTRRLMRVPGTGQPSAHAIVAAVGDGGQFASARDLAAWAGLTPREHHSANKRRAGHVSQQGDQGLRRLLTLGASAVMRQVRAKPQRGTTSSSADLRGRHRLDPDQPPATLPDLREATRAMKARAAAEVVMTTAWPCWIQLEQFSALHHIPFATRAIGFDGLDTELVINSPKHVKHVQFLLDMAKEGTFRYVGRGAAADPLLVSGQSAISFNSSGLRGDLVKSAKFDWAAAMLPYDPALIHTPLNSIVGGASLWPVTAPERSPAEYEAVAAFLAFLLKPEHAAAWHQHTGYVPGTTTGYALSKQQGFYAKNPGAELPIEQHADPNSKGSRLGRLPGIARVPANRPDLIERLGAVRAGASRGGAHS